MTNSADVVDYGFDKHKLPQGYSYPLGRTALDAALLAHKIRQAHAVYYWLTRGQDIVMRADYLGETNKGWFAAGRSSITAYAVRSATRRVINQMLTANVLPSLCTWLLNAEQAGNVWRGGDHYIYYSIKNGIVSTVEK